MATTEVKTSHMTFSVSGGNETLIAEGNYEIYSNETGALYLTVKTIGPEQKEVAYATINKQADGPISYSYQITDESKKDQIFSVVDKVYNESKAKVDAMKSKFTV